MRRALLIISLAACQAPDATFDGAGVGAVRVVEAPAPPDAGCVSPELPLTVLADALGPTRLYAHARWQGREVALLVDTGSQVTFLATDGGPDGVPAAATFGLGCEERTVIGRPYPVNETADGLPVIGTLGADWFLEHPRELDVPARVARTVAEAPPQTWIHLPYENLYGYLFVRVQLDGTDVRLGFDTGSPHSLWLGQMGRPGDQEVSSQDAYGNPLTLWLGTAALGLPQQPLRNIPVLRIVSFPSLEDSNRQLGGNIHGLFGLSAMGNRKFRIDPAGSTIHFEPN